MKCDAGASPQEWTGPITDNHCYVDGKCYDKDEHKSGSDCEKCDPSMLATDFMMVPGYEMREDGECHKKTWAEEAAAAGWREPCAQNSRSRRSRNLAQLEKAKEGAPFRSMFFKPAKRSAWTDDDDEL